MASTLAPCSAARSAEPGAHDRRRRSPSRSASRSGFAVALVNASAIDEFAQGVQTLSGDADLEVRGPRAGLRRERCTHVSRAIATSPSRAPWSRSTRASTAATSRCASSASTPSAPARSARAVGAASDRLDALRPDALFLSNAAPRVARRGAGDTLRAAGGLHAASRCVGGAARRRRPASGSAVMDIAAAQDAFARVGVALAHRPALAAGRSIADACARASQRCCRRASRRAAARRRRARPSACRAPIASTSTCWRSSRCSPAGCSCSRRRRCRWCAGARISRCCARSA